MSKKYMLMGALGVLAVLAFALGGEGAGASPPLRTYEVTLHNMTDGQPFSPGFAATHRPNFHAFQVRGLAHPGIEAIAEDGNEGPAVAALGSLDAITDLHDINRPLTPDGKTVEMFTDTLTFEITAQPGDRLSLAVMLICTNDGFTGLDGVKLPKHGSVTYHAAGYDAGTEDNTEESMDIVDPCSGLGPVPLAGDPDGNEDAAVDSDPHVAIHHHSGIEGGADLSPSMHDWTNPVAEITIERID